MTINERIMQAAQLAAPIYAANDWTWGCPDDEPRGAHVPDVGEIGMTIRRLYETASTSPAGDAASGRLYVWTDSGDDEILISVELGVLRPGTIFPTFTVQGLA